MSELAHKDYTVGWVCALPKEQTAATAMLDTKHTDLPKPPNDPNAYTLGSVGEHNVVIACLPKGKIGNNPAATVAAWMISTFPSIKFGLVVGIGGGVPPKVRLGDVVVSTPVANFPGVVQWDSGKTKEGGDFERTGALNNPPNALLSALTKLETEHDLRGSKIPEYLEELKEKWPRLASKYLKSDSLNDVLFKADYSHPRDMSVHYGLIASGNQVIKDATFRDKLNQDLGAHVLCFEMEAAGLMNSFPCIIIRGICDYADSHKNKDWQEHAAVVAAAFAKELLQYVQPSDVDGERPIKDILGHVLSSTTTLRSRMEQEKDAKILDWLTPIDYGLQHSDYLKRRQPGTGQWFLDSKEFQTWLGGDKQTLFCPGIPGAGKTILTSVVVNDLITRFHSNPEVGIAYIYFNFRQRETQKLGDILASLLKQLSQGRSSLPHSVRALYGRHEKRRTRPLLDEISSSLRSVAALYSRVFIVVDALDECQSSEGCRTRFLSEICKLQTETRANILATSRYILDITESFEESASLDIRARDEDVRSFLEKRITESGRRSLKACSEEIKSEIIKSVGGMFLLAELHFASLQWKMSHKDIRTALRELPTGAQAYEHAYKATMERIKGQAREAEELAMQVLSWVTCAKRPLRRSELRHALGVEMGNLKLDEENIPEIEDVVSVCAGLVTVDEESSIIRLVHYTTQEYFEQTQLSWFPEAQRNIASVCVTYLSFNTFESGVCSTVEELEARLQLNTLYDYAARHWAHHVRASSAETEDLILSFLMDYKKVSSCNQAMTAPVIVSKEYFGYSQWKPKITTGLHLAAYFGLGSTITELLNRGLHLDYKDNHGWTPLAHAVKNGHEVVAKQLMEKGAAPNVVDPARFSLLVWAAQNGQLEVVKMLIEKGAD
ncbi:purine and uridine phosphorylase, partial [Periconia macrospinosa]